MVPLRKICLIYCSQPAHSLSQVHFFYAWYIHENISTVFKMSMLPLAITFFHYQALFASMGFPWHALPSWGTFHSHGCVQTINDILTQKRSVRFVLSSHYMVLLSTRRRLASVCCIWATHSGVDSRFCIFIITRGSRFNYTAAFLLLLSLHLCCCQLRQRLYWLYVLQRLTSVKP